MLKVRPIGNRNGAAMDVLRAHRVLNGAPESVLVDILAHSCLVTVTARRPLFRQGDPGRTIGIMLSGYIKLSTTTTAGREVVLEICGIGSLFGELAVLNDWPRSADATALSASEVVSIPGEAFRNALTRSPEVMFALLGVLSRRLRLATEQVTDAAALPGPARLAKALGQLAALHGTAAANGLTIDIALSQGEMGGLTGLSRETINRQLNAWRELGWLDISPGHIVLRDAEALRLFIENEAGS